MKGGGGGRRLTHTGGGEEADAHGGRGGGIVVDGRGEAGNGPLSSLSPLSRRFVCGQIRSPAWCARAGPGRAGVWAKPRGLGCIIVRQGGGEGVVGCATANPARRDHGVCRVAMRQHRCRVSSEGAVGTGGGPPAVDPPWPLLCPRPGGHPRLHVFCKYCTRVHTFSRGAQASIARCACLVDLATTSTVDSARGEPAPRFGEQSKAAFHSVKSQHSQIASVTNLLFAPTRRLSPRGGQADPA